LILGARVEERPVSIDFLPPEQMRNLPTHTVSEAAVVAMFMNNRAVEALADGRVDDAYAWSRAALLQDPDMALAYNTLGVTYRHHGDLAQAAIVLRQALDRQPSSPLALSNLADTLEQMGDTLQGAALRTRLAAIDPDPPFHYYDLGLVAYRHHDYRSARDLFAKEVARAGYYHEFHFWLAVAQYRLGRVEDAGNELALARAYSTTQHDRDLYGAKLAWLRGIDGGPSAATGVGSIAR
jgi:tetratricopeptide (TPR) repeat protein